MRRIDLDRMTNDSEAYNREWPSYGSWQVTPWFLRIAGYPPVRRKKFAAWNVGGGFDGWEYSHRS